MFAQLYGLRVVQVLAFPGSTDLRALPLLPLRSHSVLLVRFHGLSDNHKTMLILPQGLLHCHRCAICSIMAASSNPRILRARHRPPSQFKPCCKRLHLRSHTYHFRMGCRAALLHPILVTWCTCVLDPPIHSLLSSSRE
jgi:hypothetical protein